MQWGGFSQIGNAARNENDGSGNTAAIVKSVGFDEKNTYWSSTEANGTQAVSVYMLNGALYNSGKVESNHYACVRKAG